MLDKTTRGSGAEVFVFAAIYTPEKGQKQRDGASPFFLELVKNIYICIHTYICMYIYIYLIWENLSIDIYVAWPQLYESSMGSRSSSTG